MSGDTILFLVVAVIFILFILPRLSSMMSGNTGTTGYPQGNTPNNNGTLGGNDRPTYDSDDVESRGSIGRDRSRNSGGIFGNGNVLSRPSGGSNSSSGTGIFRTPSSSSNRGNLGSSSSSRADSPNVESHGSIGRDRD